MGNCLSSSGEMESTVGMADLTSSIGQKLKQRALGLENSTSNNGEDEVAEQLCDRCSGVRSSGACAGRAEGRCCCTPNGLPSPLCVYYSPRIMDLLEGRRTEFETTQDHWTIVDPTSKAETGTFSDPEAEAAAEAERVGEENRKYFDEVLANHPEWGHFFTKFQDLEVGAKIGEGGQAEVFAASSQSFKHPCRWAEGLKVAKVWKEGVSLKDLERQWPPQMLSLLAQGGGVWPFSTIYGGAFMRDGEFKNRFAFVMERRGCDLRSYTDHRMLELLLKKNHGPPFKHIRVVYQLLHWAAWDLVRLHGVGVVHRDIKASNVLLQHTVQEDIPEEDKLYSFVIDYECSVGVIGTGFWRAPEILEQVLKRVHISKMEFTKEADIYSFGMMYYEMVSGCIPFEGHPQNDYSIVLRGERLELLQDLDPRFKGIIMDCWHHNPQLRSIASDLESRLKTLCIRKIL